MVAKARLSRGEESEEKERVCRQVLVMLDARRLRRSLGSASCLAARTASSLGASGSSEMTLCGSKPSPESESSTWYLEPGEEVATPLTAARRTPPSFFVQPCEVEQT